MKHLSLLALFIALISAVNAQEVTLNGLVTEKESGEPVSYANILVVNAQDSVLTGTLSNPDGEFSLEIVPQQGLLLRTSGLGYKEQDHSLSFSGEKTQSLEPLIMEKDVALLDEVSVGAQNTVIQKFDRKVYSMNENRKAAAKDIYDLLRTLPGVIVDEEKNVRYRGAEASILVDDMPAQYMYPDLEMIPVASVDKIELIDAAMQTGEIGAGGIINIKMKVVREDGLSGVANVRASVEPYELNSGNTYLNLNLKKKNWVFFNNFYGMQGTWAGESENTGSLAFGEEIYQSEGISSYSYTYHYLSDYIGAQYNFTDKTKLVFAAGLHQNGSVNESGNSYTQNLNETPVRSYDFTYTEDDQSMSGNFYVFFRHSFDTTLREFKGWVSVNLPDMIYENDNLSRYHYSVLASTPVDSIYTTFIDKISRSGGLYSGLFYNHPVNEKTRWNANYRLSSNILVKSDEDFYENDQLILQQSDSESGSRLNQSLSLRLGSTFGKWKLDGGVKLEHYHFDYDILSWMGDDTDTVNHIGNNYLNVLPSATIVFSIDSLQDMKLSYSRSARTPWYTQLNPLLYKRSPYSWTQGNPDLEPVIFENLYFGYSLNKPMWNVSADLFYSLTSNDIAYLQYPLSESLELSMPDNYAYQSRFGLDLSGFYSIKGKYNFNLSGNVYHSTIDSGDLTEALEALGVVPENVVKRNYGYDLKLTANVSFSRNTSAMLYLRYNSREYSLDGYESDRISSSLSMTQRFFNRRLTVSLGINNLFNDFMARTSHYEYLGQVTDENILYSTEMQRMVFLSLNYRFNKGDRNTGSVGQGNE